MKAEKRTPPEAPDGAQRCVGVRPSCGPHVHKYIHPRREDKPKRRPKSARSRRAGSRHQPGSAYRPPKETLARRQREVLDLLKVRGPRGVTKLDAPSYLSLSLSARVCDLRSKGYRIDTLCEWVGDARIGRYVLVAPEPVPEVGAVP